MSDKTEYFKINMTVIPSDADVMIPNSPELTAHLASMELGCRVSNMRKRSFLFFKRRLKPHEKAAELLKLQLEMIENE